MKETESLAIVSLAICAQFSLAAMGEACPQSRPSLAPTG